MDVKNLGANEKIKAAKKKFLIVLLVMILFQVVFCVIANFTIGAFEQEFNVGQVATDFALIKRISLCLLVSFSLLIDALFYTIRIHRLNTLSHVQPIKVIVEDFIITAYVDEGRRKYWIYPLVKNVVNQKLYFTYGRYSLSWYSTRYEQTNNVLDVANIIRQDGSIVKIGDTASLYLGRILNLPLNINTEEQIVYVNHKKFNYIHVNQAHNVDIFRDITIFEGAIDVEPFHIMSLT